MLLTFPVICTSSMNPSDEYKGFLGFLAWKKARNHQRIFWIEKYDFKQKAPRPGLEPET